MSEMQNPFDSIESAQDFMGLLSEAIEEAIRDVAEDKKIGQKEGQERRVEALNLAHFKLRSLNEHIEKSRKILKDLHSIRRILVGDLPDAEEEDDSVEASADASGQLGI